MKKKRGIEELNLAGQVAKVDARLLSAGERAIYAAHDRAGGWYFAAPNFLDRPTDRREDIPLERLVGEDPSLAEVCNLKPGWHAFRSTPADPWWSSEMPRGGMYLLSYEARPTELVEDRDGIGGAFVNCWVMQESTAAAVAQARAHLEETGWAIVRTMAEHTIDASDVDDADQTYFQHAQIEGEVYVIHAFPPADADA